MSFLGRLKSGLARTQEKLSLRLREVFTGRTKVDEALYEELEAALIESDLGPRTARRLLDAVTSRVREQRIVDASQVREVLGAELRALLGQAPQPVPLPTRPPLVSLIIGVNGVGKTTTIGKLAQLHRTAGRSVILCAADTFRAAASEQLGIWAERSGARLVRHQEGADPSAVVYDALATANARGTDVVIIDTAGRLHTKDNLMSELEKVRRVVTKQVPGGPHETLLILDASTGQNAIAQAREFSARVGVNGLIVTKIDGTARGGVVASIIAELGVPVRYLGVGEGIDDLIPFDPEAFANALIA